MEDLQQRIEIKHVVKWEGLNVEIFYDLLNLGLRPLNKHSLEVSDTIKIVFPECSQEIHNFLEMQFKSSLIFQNAVKDFRIKLKRILE